MKYGDFVWGDAPVPLELPGFEIILRANEYACARRLPNGPYYVIQVTDRHVVLRPVMESHDGEFAINMIEEHAVVFPQVEVGKPNA